MTFRRLNYIFFVVTIFICNKAFSQTKDIASQENRFVNLYSKLFSFVQSDYDSILLYSEKFGKEFTSFISANPTTLNYSFRKLIDSNNCHIKTASDGNFRIYSWDTWTGGTMRIFNEIYQWRDKGKVFTKVPTYTDGDPGSFCSKIFTVIIKNKPYYLAVTNGIYSSKDAIQSISVYAIDNKLVDTVKMFKTKKALLNRIDVEFDFFSVVDRPERPLELIAYDKKQKIIYIPVIGDKGKVTNKNILYQLKSRYFEFIGIETGK